MPRGTFLLLFCPSSERITCQAAPTRSVLGGRKPAGVKGDGLSARSSNWRKRKGPFLLSDFP